MKKITILLLVVAILSLTPYHAFAKPRVFITFSDFISNGKYNLYKIKTSDAQSKVQQSKTAKKTQLSKTKRNIFVKTSKKY